MISNLDLRGSGRMRNEEDLTRVTEKLRPEEWQF